MIMTLLFIILIYFLFNAFLFTSGYFTLQLIFLNQNEADKKKHLILFSIAPSISFSLIALFSFILHWSKLPLFYSFVPSIILSILYLISVKKTVHILLKDIPLNYLLCFVLISTVYLFFIFLSPVFINPARGIDGLQYFMNTLFFSTHETKIYRWDTFGLLSSRPPFYQTFIASFNSFLGNDFRGFQLISIMINCFFFSGIYGLIRYFYQNKIAIIIIFFVILNSAHFNATGIFFPKHIATFCLVASMIILLLINESKPLRSVLLCAFLFSAGYYTHNSIAFYLPLLFYILYYKKLFKPRLLLAFISIGAGLALLIFFYKYRHFSFTESLIGNPGISDNRAEGVTQQLAKWAMNFGSSFTPAYLLYIIFLSSSLDYPVGFQKKWDLFSCYFPAHASDAWYLAADIIGILLIVWSAFLLLKNNKFYLKDTYCHFKSLLRNEFKMNLFFRLTLMGFIMVSIGIFFNPYWTYGGNHTIGLLGMCLVQIFILGKLIEKLNYKIYVGIITFTLLEFLYLSIYNIKLIEDAYKNQSFMKYGGYDYAEEVFLKKHYNYLYDLTSQEIRTGMITFIIITLSAFAFYLLKKAPLKSNG